MIKVPHTSACACCACSPNSPVPELVADSFIYSGGWSYRVNGVFLARFNMWCVAYSAYEPDKFGNLNFCYDSDCTVKYWNEWAGAYVEEQFEMREVVIPTNDDSLSRKVKLRWVCPECGVSRGEPFKRIGFYKGQEFEMDGWSQECGHYTGYMAANREADSNGLNR